MIDKVDDTIKRQRWNESGFNKFGTRELEVRPPPDYISGEGFDIRLDDLTFNRMLQFKNLPKKPQGNDTGKIYYNTEDKKLYMWIDATGKWAEVLYTTTSTSTTSTSTTSTSISTTSTSTTSTSTSTTSTSTTTT